MLGKEQRKPIRILRSRNTSLKKYNQVRASVAPFDKTNRSTWNFILCVFLFSMLRLEFPNTSHKSEYLSIMEEWAPSSPWALFRWESFEEFLQLAKDDIEKGNRHGVPATLFFLVNDENRILGAIQIRHHINHPNLMEYGGHIGYGIRPSERGKWYATEMLRLALIESRKLGLQKVLLGCHDDNIASQKTIEKNGGIFDRYTEYELKKSRRYWINL